MVKTRRAVLAAGAVVAASALLMQPAAAKDWYEGKQLKITIGFGFGGTYGQYARMFAAHLGKYIPGNPNIIVQSMPGAGGLKAMNFAANVMPADGLNMFMPVDSSVVAQLIFEGKVKYDARKFIPLGSANQTNVILVARSDSGIQKWEDLKTKQIIMGSTGRGSTGFLIPNLVNGLTGTKMKIITGYKGSSKTGLAVEQGEVNGAAFNWLFWKSKYERWFQGDKPFARAVLQVGHFKDPELPNVPMLKDHVKAEHLPIVNFVGTLGLIGRGLAVPAGTPTENVAILRAAFDKMVADPEFVADAKNRKLRVIGATGKQIQDAIQAGFAAASPEVVVAARKAILGRE